MRELDGGGGDDLALEDPAATLGEGVGEAGKKPVAVEVAEALKLKGGGGVCGGMEVDWVHSGVRIVSPCKGSHRCDPVRLDGLERENI